MEMNALLEKVKQLPAPLRKEVEDFVDFLIFKDESQDEQLVQEKTFRELNNQKEKPISGSSLDELQTPYNEKSKLKREFGGLKGFVTYMAEDFDAPLEDFKDYM